MAVEKVLLTGVDYLMFAFMLLISAAIGIYFRFSGGKQKTTEEYLLAGKDMSILPVSFSLMASFLSAITIVGTPTEIYHFGIHLAYCNISYVIGMTISSYVTLPVFFEMQASTAYEYLERRFGNNIRTLSSIAFVIQMILFMSVVLYAPALALSAVTNLSTWVSIVSVGIVCTFYCTIGGMKAVLWTDVFQSFLMYFGIFSVIIKGFLDVGFDEVFKRAYEGGRLPLPEFDFNLYHRYTFWNIMVQGIFLSLSSFGANQVQIQRLLTVKNISRARKALYLSMPLGVVFHLLICLAGVIVYTYFVNCDPLTPPNNPIHKGDQLLPYFMMKSLGEYPGLPGLCICGVFSASLSTVSSAVNSLTAVTMQDLIRPFLEARGVSQKMLSVAAQVITLFYGFLCIILTFVFASLGSLVQITLTVFGVIGGPVLGVFLLGMLTTRTTEKGAILGLLISIGFTGWIGFGASLSGNTHLSALPVSTDGCPWINSSLNNQSDKPNATEFFLENDYPNFEVTEMNNSTDFVKLEPKQKHIFLLYRISYMWFVGIGFVLTYIIGYFASIVINSITGEKKEVPEELISPVMKRFHVKKKSEESNKSNFETKF